MGEWFERVALGTLPFRAARRFGAREALAFEGRRWTFEDFDRDVDRAARGLLAAGVEPGEKVALWLPNRPVWLHAFFGALKIGAVVLPLNIRLRTHDLAYALAASDSSTLVLADRAGPVDFLAMALELLPELREGVPDSNPSRRCPLLRRVIVDGFADSAEAPGVVSWEELLERGEEVPAARLEALAAAVDVVAAPDARLSEVPVAFVIPRPGEAPDPEELRDFCRGSIAGFKIPRRFFLVGEFPMTASGKVQRFRLRAEAEERLREEEPPPRNGATGSALNRQMAEAEPKADEKRE